MTINVLLIFFPYLRCAYPTLPSLTRSMAESSYSAMCLFIFQVRGAKAEETQGHVHRMYFMGPNTFREPWHLPYSPPTAIFEIV